LKRVVLLAPYFLPRRRVGSWRPFKFAIHLQEYGWEPHIITIQEKKETLTAREADLLADIPIYEIKSPIDFTHQIGRQLEYNGSNAYALLKKTGTKKNKFKPVLNWIDKHFPIDTWLPLLFFRQEVIKKFIETIDPHLLWSTGDPWSSHWLAKKLANQYDLPWVADFRDPWTLGDLKVKQRANFVRGIDKKQEKSVIKESSALTFTSHQTEKLYARHYPSVNEKGNTIFNSFDSTLFKDEMDAEALFDEKHLNLIFFGKFRPLSPATPFIEILSKMKQKHPDQWQKIRMHSFGTLSKREISLAKAKGVYQNFVSFKPIALENALPVLRQADVLWLSTHPGRKNIIPAKLWDYLAARRPILSVAPNPEIEKILQQTGTGVQLQTNHQTAVVKLLRECVCAKSGNSSFPISTVFDDQAIKRYDADVTTQKLAHIFDDLT